MKEIKMLAEMMRDELEDSAEYAKCALKYKDTDSRLGDLFYNLAKAELDHANMEHEQAERLIREFTGETPEAMRAVYEWEHDKMIDETVRIKSLMEMYKA